MPMWSYVYAVWHRLMMSHPLCAALLREMQRQVPVDPKRGGR